MAYASAVVLTEHRYSTRKRYQLIVPLEDRAAVDPLDGDIVVENRDWLERLELGSSGAILAVNEIQSVFHPVDIAGWTGAVVDEGTMGAIEAALRKLFEL